MADGGVMQFGYGEHLLEIATGAPDRAQRQRSAHRAAADRPAHDMRTATGRGVRPARPS